MTNQCILLTAPPAWGKTRFLLQFMQEHRGKYIYLSPLRALCEEFYDQCSKVYPTFRREEVEKLSLLKDFCLVATAEGLLYGLGLKRFGHYTIILDEFHLYYHWGNTFRPTLWESLMAVYEERSSLLALSATIEPWQLTSLECEFKGAYSEIFHIDYGNFKLKNPPYRRILINYFPVKVLQLIMYGYLLEARGCVLCFVPFRRQAMELAERYKLKGFSALYCIGGSSQEFSLKLKQKGRVDIIFATTALSHGVNLPQIKAIFIFYSVRNRSFLLQMMGRGGRKGEKYDLYYVDEQRNTLHLACQAPYMLLKTCFIGVSLIISRILRVL